MSMQHLGIDDEEFCMDIIPKVETSFGVHFQQHDLTHVGTFGELCEAVLTKLSNQGVHDCTTQQAFYKIRQAFKNQLPDVAVKPSTPLATLLPAGRQKRRRVVAAVEAQLGVKLNVLGTAATTQVVGLLLLVGFGATMFFDKSIGGIGLAFTWGFFYFADKLGSTIQIENVRTVVEQMSAQYYRQSRRNPHAINRTEIVKQLQHLFTQSFGFELAALTPDALLF